MRTHTFSTALLVSLFALACSGGEDAPEPVEEAPAPAAEPTPQPGAPAGTASMPAWFRVSGNEVQMDVTAGSTPANNNWNFNGGTNGSMTITVPVGAQVTLNFTNSDPNMAHSAGIAPMSATTAATPAAEPVFAGAITADATSMTESTLSGETETITFTADQPGEYALLCYIPGHAVTGMWVRFNVGGEAGVTGATQ